MTYIIELDIDNFNLLWNKIKDDPDMMPILDALRESEQVQEDE